MNLKNPPPEVNLISTPGTLDISGLRASIIFAVLLARLSLPVRVTFIWAECEPVDPDIEALLPEPPMEVLTLSISGTLS